MRDTRAATESAPRCGGGASDEIRRALCGGARRLMRLLPLGRLKTGPGGGPVLLCLKITPNQGRPQVPDPHMMRVARTGRLGRRDVRARTRGRPLVALAYLAGRARRSAKRLDQRLLQPGQIAVDR